METHINIPLEQFRDLLTRCSGKKVAIDTETTGLLYFRDRLTTVGFYCPEAGIEGTIDLQPQEEVRAIVRESLAPGTIVIMHNAKFDLGFLDADPNIVNWRIVDTTVLVHLYDSRLPKNLEASEKYFLGSNSKREAIDDSTFPQPEVYDENGKKKRGKPKVWDWNSQKRQLYCVNDCRVTYQLAEKLYPMIRNMGMAKLFSMQMLYLRDLYTIEHFGIKLDVEFMHDCIAALKEDLILQEQQLYDAAGHEFNWHSNVQLSHVLYEELGHPRPVSPFGKNSKFANRGQYNKTATSSFILLEKAKHPLGELISSMRETSKFIKTLEQWESLKDENDVLHANFNLTGTRTGRLSCSQPNLQNIPNIVRNIFVKREAIRTDEYGVRKAFIARSGYTHLSIDYRQMEVRFFGWLSQDPNMLNALAGGGDLHALIADKVWGISDRSHRQFAKAVTFGLVYGASSGSLSFRLDLSRERAQEITDDYRRTFPRIMPWMDEIRQECELNGYVRYWSGRIWKEDNPEDFYKGVNAAIQGGMADMLAVAEMRVMRWLKENPVGRIVNIIHDEFLMEIESDKVEFAADNLAKIMEVEDLFHMPFPTDCKSGPSYGSLISMEFEDGHWKEKSCK